jgi:hypothetical protein
VDIRMIRREVGEVVEFWEVYSKSACWLFSRVDSEIIQHVRKRRFQGAYRLR